MNKDAKRKLVLERESRIIDARTTGETFASIGRREGVSTERVRHQFRVGQRRRTRLEAEARIP